MDHPTDGSPKSVRPPSSSFSSSASSSSSSLSEVADAVPDDDRKVSTKDSGRNDDRSTSGKGEKKSRASLRGEREERKTAALDFASLRERLQEIKHMQEKSGSHWSEKRAQEGLNFLLDQEDLLRKKLDSTASSPEKKFPIPAPSSSSSSKKRSEWRSSSTSLQQLLNEVSGEIKELRDYLVNKRGGSSGSSRAPAVHKKSAGSTASLKRRRGEGASDVPNAKESKQKDANDVSTTEESFTNAEYSVMSELDTESFEDFSDDEGALRSCSPVPFAWPQGLC